MTDEVKIPFGFKRIFGQAQKGDGIYDRVAGRFVKVKKNAYPYVTEPEVLIRKCEVEQPELVAPEESEIEVMEM